MFSWHELVIVPVLFVVIQRMLINRLVHGVTCLIVIILLWSGIMLVDARIRVPGQNSYCRLKV
jgi:hypothetical protein